MSEKIDWSPTNDNFGELLPFICNESITDIDMNAQPDTGKVDVWIKDLRTGVTRLPSGFVSMKFVEQFCNLVANTINRPFNPQHVSIEADTKELRISILHESVTTTGRCICIRKSPPILRNTIVSLLESQFCEKEVLSLLINCVHCCMNIVICGVPGAGKTEFLKFLTQFIEQRVTTIEDNPEIHFHEVNPDKSCVAIRVVPGILDYSQAIKKALRYDTEWILLSEARGREARELMEAWSTGTHGFTTIHTDDIRKLPDRIQSMIGEEGIHYENKIYSFLHVGVLIKKRQDVNGVEERYLDQAGFFIRENGKNQICMIVEDGKLTCSSIPEEIQRKFMEKGIANPYVAEEIERRETVEQKIQKNHVK